MAAGANNQSEIAVVGGGPSGLIAALAIAQTGAETLLVAPLPEFPDRRTTALLGGSSDALAAIGVWERLAPEAAPLRKLRIADGSRRLIRSPEILFDAGELDLDTFGFNVENEALLKALRAAAASQPNLRIVTAPVTELRIEALFVELTLSDATLERARLVVAADGRSSSCRAAAGIKMTKRGMVQYAIALSLSHTRSHNDTSTEFHTEQGPFTLVPLRGLRSSLVWVCTPKEVARIRALPEDALNREIERKSSFILGEINADAAKGVFPLEVSLADSFGASRVALVGEAGHVLPPIGAQGLNLGIRDAISIARTIGEARTAGSDTGAAESLEAYDRDRRADIRSRAVAVEALGRSLLTGFLPVHLARGLGLEIVSRAPILRRALMRSGLGVQHSA